MRAVLLAGGLGTRLRPLTFSIPKPLLPVGEKPILEIILDRLKEFGFREFILSVGYRAELIETYFGDGTRFDAEIHYLKEEKPTGTAGSLHLLRQGFDIAAGTFDLKEPILFRGGAGPVSNRENRDIPARGQRRKRPHPVGGGKKDRLHAGKIDLYIGQDGNVEHRADECADATLLKRGDQRCRILLRSGD